MQTLNRRRQIGVAFLLLALTAPLLSGWDSSDVLGVRHAEDPVSGCPLPSTPGIRVTKVVADARGEALVDITYVSSQQIGTELASVQFDVRYDSPALDVSAALGPAADASVKTLWTSRPEPGKTRILIAGLNQNTLADGVIARLKVQVAADFPAGLYSLDLEGLVASNPAGNPVFVPSTGGSVAVLGGSASFPRVLAVTSAASYSGGSVAPGEIIVVWGNRLASERFQLLEIGPDARLSNCLGSTRVLFDGILSPIIYTIGGQLSAVVPYAIGHSPQTAMQVEFEGIRSAPVTLPVTQTHPGIFTLDQSGSGQGTIVNDDGTANGIGNPAARGSWVSIYGTGEGQTNPAGVDGLIVGAGDLRSPTAPVRVLIGGVRAEVLYAGSGGEQLSGVFQVNVRVPTGITPGSSVPVTLVVGNSQSQAGVTMAVR